MSTLLDFCKTQQQKDIITKHLAGMKSQDIARDLGLSPTGSGVRKIIALIKAVAADRGFSPEHHRHVVYPEKQVVTGYSDLVRYPEDDPLGRIIGWIKTNRSLASQVSDARGIIEAMSVDIPSKPPVVYQGNVKSSQHFTVIPLGDPHIGLRTWSEEVGAEWDAQIAMRVFHNVFSRLLARTPDTERVVLFNSGDFFHADNIAGETSRSGHKLDLDGRPGYWLDIGVQIMVMLIDMCLAKYRHVHFVNTPGNHDDILGMALGTFARHLYRDNPHFTCSPGHDPFQYLEIGRVALGFCHGHTCRLPSLPGKMATDMAAMWGRTTYRHWITGHVHHNQWVQFKEFPGCTIESVGIIPPKDAYAHGKGYGAGRGTQLLVFDADGGYMPDRFCEAVLASD